MRKHNGRAAQPRDDVGHGEGLAGTGHAQQGLEHLAVVNALNQFVNRLGLVACGRVRLYSSKGEPGKVTNCPIFGASITSPISLVIAFMWSLLRVGLSELPELKKCPLK